MFYSEHTHFGFVLVLSQLFVGESKYVMFVGFFVLDKDLAIKLGVNLCRRSMLANLNWKIKKILLLLRLSTKNLSEFAEKIVKKEHIYYLTS